MNKHYIHTYEHCFTNPCKISKQVYRTNCTNQALLIIIITKIGLYCGKHKNGSITSNWIYYLKIITR